MPSSPKPVASKPCTDHPPDCNTYKPAETNQCSPPSPCKGSLSAWPLSRPCGQRRAKTRASLEAVGLGLHNIAANLYFIDYDENQYDLCHEFVFAEDGKKYGLSP